MEQVVKILIYIHASLGGVALITGLVAILTPKGQTAHKKSGSVFFYAMLASVIISMFVALSPNHHNPFLFAIGIFSLYFILTGFRALKFKKQNTNLTVDRWISATMIITGVLMILLPVIVAKNSNIILTVFGAFGILFSVKDLILYKKPKQLRKSWLRLHLSKMLGGYIAATTAFVVVNQFFPSFYGWFIPGIIGGFVIAYWNRKITKKA
ncbi:DUF2306 domain-containing protein [Flavobacterium sp. NRK F10]|uniref:DUF2306 domain-containing protein n=1 Tax=Flavobacterium sp. NRK F10 TaxID=2954931 RepID=UPI0020910F66|nr:DUF2306 domain-containing protein [Flavobacterium sp. NRK F10]MCO6176412.1 DUF2306 domain-containing protein [Flavobacterium sp. NRK F10]